MVCIGMDFDWQGKIYVFQRRRRCGKFDWHRENGVPRDLKKDANLGNSMGFWDFRLLTIDGTATIWLLSCCLPSRSPLQILAGCLGH